ncbi:LysR family glycine cleavage system transcriptional activator [Luteibacter sp. Sphag1AF]|uniref:LysR substrate-binding domain-containing protein n=1 Tax=Luteibacter sp. Sphag1AF TaxID=2587031 RepID=UPI0016151089|nr:LysR substrate-binding domain-containing protein [Luteibacter sp. Sphag1AF]MBB3227940.1 LysR family glycine cleavage system transcriptional activator [Luteibacter sp. Sphag1AF]
MSRMPLALLQGFVLVARTGKLSSAADQLNLTVSALSHQIRNLESRLGRRLFERGPRGVALTMEGNHLLDAIGHHFDGIEQALHRYAGRHQDALTVSVLPSVASSWLVPRLPRLVARHPELELSLQSTAALVDFDREPVDAAIRYGLGQWPRCISERLFGEYIVPVASPALIERMGGMPDTSLTGWPLLGDPSGRWTGWADKFGMPLPNRYVARFDNTETLQRAALEGMGVALARLVMARSLIECGSLVVLCEERLRVAEAYYLVYPRRSESHAGVAAFRDWLREEAACHEAGIGMPRGA